MSLLAEINSRDQLARVIEVVSGDVGREESLFLDEDQRARRVVVFA